MARFNEGDRVNLVNGSVGRILASVNDVYVHVPDDDSLPQDTVYARGGLYVFVDEQVQWEAIVLPCEVGDSLWTRAKAAS